VKKIILLFAGKLTPSIQPVSSLGLRVLVDGSGITLSAIMDVDDDDGDGDVMNNI
jgi:hypothetical protein